MKSEAMPTQVTTFFLVVLVYFVFSEWGFCIAASEILCRESNFHGGKTGIVRDRPVPIPGSGMQLTNISHVRDLSSMLTLAVENPTAASRNIFNCVSDRAVTLDGMARLCAKAAGREVKIVHYDPKTIGADAKKAFPFRNMVCCNNYQSSPLYAMIGMCATNFWYKLISM